MPEPNRRIVVLVAALFAVLALLAFDQGNQVTAIGCVVAGAIWVVGTTQRYGIKLTR